MDEITKQLTELVAEVKTFKAKAEEDIRLNGAASSELKAELKSTLEKLDERVDAVQSQADAIDLKISERHLHAGGQQPKTAGELLTTSPRFQEAHKLEFISDHKFVIPLEGPAFPRDEKALITDATLGAGTSGVIMPTRLPGIVGMPRQELRIRDLMPVRTLPVGHSFDWVKQTVRATGASPQVEGSAKAESTVDYDTETGTTQTIAHFLHVTRQALADVPWLRGQIDSELMYGLKLKEEAEILAGDGTGVHLDGIITQATAYDTALYNPVSGYTRLDQLRRAKLQVRLAGLATFAASGFVLHPTDMAALELLKDADGLYIIGNPTTGTAVTLIWGLPVVESDSISAGTFLVGAFSTAAEIVDRMNAVIAISFEHANNFTENKATILCEERVGLAVKRPSAFVYGSFSSSPA